MIRHKALSLLGLAAMFLVFNGESCFVEQRDSDFVVRADVPAVWHTQGGGSSGSDTESVSAATEVDNALASLSGDAEVDSIVISGVCYEVLANSGFVGMHAGSVTVAATGQSPLPLLTFSAPSNAAGVTGDSEGAEVSLTPAGVNFVNARLAQYLAMGDDSLLDFTFAASWTSTPPGEEEYNFDWKTCLILQVTGTLTLDVFDP